LVYTAPNYTQILKILERKKNGEDFKTFKMSTTSQVSSSVTETNTKHYYAFKAAFEVPVLSCYIIIIAVAVVGNLMVCYAILVDRNLRNNPTTLLLLSLALSDLLTVTISASLHIDVFFVRGTWVHGELICKISSTIFVTTVPTSIWTLLAISVDRYKSLRDPMSRFRRSPFMTRKRALIINILIWSYSVLFASIPLMGWREAPGDSVIFEGICWYPYPPAYSALTNILNCILPLLITSGIYIKIYCIACEQNKILLHGQLASIEDKSRLGSLQAAKAISMFVGVFFFCRVPYSMYIILISLCDWCWAITPDEAYIILLMLGYLKSALNPFLFALQNKSFKATYSKLFSSAFFKSRSRLRDRRDSTLTQLTFTSEIPDSTDNDVRLQWISTWQDELPCESVHQETTV